MLQLLNRFVDICLLRRGPQDLPASPAFTACCLAAYGIVVAVSEALLGQAARALIWPIMALLVLVLVVRALLRLRGHSLRIYQTLSALSGCGVLYYLVFLPLSLGVGGDSQTEVAVNPVLGLSWMLVFFWGFAIDGHIYRHALSVSFPAGVLVSVVLFAATSTLYWAFFVKP